MHLVGFTIGKKRQDVYCAVRHSFSFRLSKGVIRPVKRFRCWEQVKDEQTWKHAELQLQQRKVPVKNRNNFLPFYRKGKIWYITSCELFTYVELNCFVRQWLETNVETCCGLSKYSLVRNISEKYSASFFRAGVRLFGKHQPTTQDSLR